MPKIELDYQTVTLPLMLVRAVLSIVPKPEKKDQEEGPLNSVFVHRDENNVRLVSCDGQRFVIASHPAPADAPEWLESGLMIARSGLVRAAGYLAAIQSPTVNIGYLENAGRAALSDCYEECLFRVRPVIEGSFPDYRRALDGLDIFAARQAEEMDSRSYTPEYLRGISDLAKLVEVSMVKLYQSPTDSGVSLVTFPECPPLVMLMATIIADPQIALPAPTAQILRGPVSGTIAALTAHQTRARNKLAKTASVKARADLQAKIADYDVRIAEHRASLTLALPAPEVAEPEAEIEATEETNIASFRGALTGEKRARALDKFIDDTAEALADDAGDHTAAAYRITLDRAAVEQLFDDGLTPQQAADVLAAAFRDTGTDIDTTLAAAE